MYARIYCNLRYCLLYRYVGSPTVSTFTMNVLFLREHRHGASISKLIYYSWKPYYDFWKLSSRHGFSQSKCLILETVAR